jgi:hypothetical protein
VRVVEPELLENEEPVLSDSDAASDDDSDMTARRSSRSAGNMLPTHNETNAENVYITSSLEPVSKSTNETDFFARVDQNEYPSTDDRLQPWKRLRTKTETNNNGKWLLGALAYITTVSRRWHILFTTNSADDRPGSQAG